MLKLPAAEAAVFKFAHAATLSEKIVEHMKSGDPDLEKHAMDVSARLISTVCKAQKNQTQPIIINNAINTGRVRVAGTPGNLRRPRPQHIIDAAAQTPDRALRSPDQSSTPPAAPDAKPSASAGSSEALAS